MGRKVNFKEKPKSGPGRKSRKQGLPDLKKYEETKGEFFYG